MVISLIKKILCRKDYVEIIEARYAEDDNVTINSFLENIYNERGKIIKIQGMEKKYTINGSDDYYGEPGRQDIVSENSYLIHYKCHKQIKHQL